MIGQVHHSAADLYLVQLTPHSPLATLPHLAFEAATRKTRPQLATGSLVYARVALAERQLDAPELECVSANTGRADGLGALPAGGTAIDVSIGFARRLLRKDADTGGGVAVLEELGGLGLAFETAVGRNGRVWVGGDDVKAVVAVCRALQETDSGNLNVEAQRRLARRLVREVT